MKRFLERLPDVARVLIGLMWLVAAGAKIAAPFKIHQFVARAAPVGLSPKLLLAVMVAVEAALGAAMCLRVVRGFGWSLGLLGVASAAALVVRAQTGGFALCGCFGSLTGTTVDEALVRAGILAAIHVALIVTARTRAIAVTPRV